MAQPGHMVLLSQFRKKLTSRAISRVTEVVAAGDDGTDGDGDEFEEAVQAAAFTTGVGQKRELSRDRGGVAARHDCPPWRQVFRTGGILRAFTCPNLGRGEQ